MMDEQPAVTPDTPSIEPAQPVGDASVSSATPREPVTGRRKRRSGAPRTRVSSAFVAAVVGVLLLLLLLIFILENTETVTVNFLGAKGHLGLGVALLLSAVGGALIVAILGAARIAQLRRVKRR